MKPSSPRFTDDTLAFLLKAARQKRVDWLDRNREEYEKHLLKPLQNMAAHLKTELAPSAVGYNFPQKGIGRIKRPSFKVEEDGKAFKSWVTYNASTPRTSRFDHNPNLFFLIDPTDVKEGILVAGGLYMPSSRQLRSLREAISEDASPFEELFASKEFARCFPEGFSDERTATRPPRGFDPNHPKIKWLKLQAFFVWHPYTRKEFKSAQFPELVARDWKQVLRLNVLLDHAIQGRLAKTVTVGKPSKLFDRLTSVDAGSRKMDF